MAQKQLWDDSPNAWVVMPLSTVLGRNLVQISGGREGERRAREVVLAFFGPDFIKTGSRNILTTSSSGEIYITSFAVSNEDWEKKLSLLDQMTKTRMLSKPIERSIAQPLENLLRDFYLELQSGNETGASAIATQIELSGLLRGDNLLFLRIHQLATFEKWSDIYSLNSFEDLTKIRRSRQTSNHLMRTLWYRDFNQCSATENPIALRDHFIALRTQERYRDLLGSLTKSHHREVRTLLALFFGLLDDQLRFADLCVDLDDDEVDRLCLLSGIQYVSKSDQSDPQSGQVLAGHTTVKDVKHPILELMELSDYEGILSYVESHPEDLTSVGHGILAAIELSDAQSAKRVIDVIDLGLCELPESRLLKRQIGDLRSKAEGVCTGWLDWAKQSADVYRPDVFETVSINAESWDTDWCDNFESTRNFSSDIENAFVGPNKAQVSQSIAFILELVGENATRAAIGEVRNSALNLLVSLEMSNAQIRNAFVSLIASYEDGNVSVAEYEDLLDSASVIWGTYGSVSNFSWILDVVEQVLKLPRLSEGKLQSLIHQIHGSLQSFGESLDSSLHNLFCKIVSEFVQINPRDIGLTSVGEDVWGKYSGKKVGIYSLLESLPELKIYLELVCPSATFMINQEKVASNELRQFASTSDFVVIQTSKSKHAATEELNKYINGERIYVAGRGRGSIINALLNYAPK
jgi:hypothetical protein